MTNEPKMLKRAVIKEELIAITGDFIKAIILNQFIYWSQRIKDYDKFIVEEKERAEKVGEEYDVKPMNGWMYKTAKEMSEETMLGYKDTAIREHIKILVKKGYLSEGKNPNPKYKWDRTIFYRVNILAIQLDLLEIGYNLEGYKNPFTIEELQKVIHKQSNSRNLRIVTPKSENCGSESENCMNTEVAGYFPNKVISESENCGSESENRCLESEDRYPEIIDAITEITTETTPESIYLNINNESWKQVVNNLKTRVSPMSLNTWILPLQPETKESSLILTCPNGFTLDWIRSRYMELIKSSLPSNTGLTEIMLRVEGNDNGEVYKL